LAGPRHYAEGPVMDAWMGGGTPQATYEDICRSLYILTVACLINAMTVAALMLADVHWIVDAWSRLL
jgi:adenosylcobinamide-phosphate synthase